MTLRAGNDPSLALPELPALDQPLGSLEFPLQATLSPTSDAPFTVAGRRAFAMGRADRAILEVFAYPIRLAAALGVRDAAAGEATITPVGVERQLTVGGAVVLERIVVPREAPVCLVEWYAPDRAVELTVEWTCDLGGSAPLRWRRGNRGLVVAEPGETRAVFMFDGIPGALEVHALPGAAPGVRIEARLLLERGDSARLALIGGMGAAPIQRALAVAGRASLVARGRRGHAKRLRSDRLAVEAPDPAAGAELEWAKVRLDALRVDAPGGGRTLLAGYEAGQRAHYTPAAVMGALAAQATGDVETARDVLAFLGRSQRESGEVAGACTSRGSFRYDDPTATPYYLLLAGHMGRWTGDLRTLRAAWPRLQRAIGFCRSAPLAGGALALWRAARSPLADAAEAIGAGETAAALRSEDDEAQEQSDTGGRIPMIEPGPSAGPYTALGAAGLVLRLVGGLLGAEPDASRGRLVLRPRPPAGWERFAVRGIMVGTASVALHYARESGCHRLRLVQERGAAPVNVVMEPALTGSRLRSAGVDGAAAELDARPAGDRIVVPVQLVLDHPREVVMEVE